MSGFRAHLPNDTLGPEHETINGAYYAGCKLTWYTEMNTYDVKVFNHDFEPPVEVKSYYYCDKCNYDGHYCPGCGGDVPHNSSGVCDPCWEDMLKEEAARVAQADPTP